MLYFALYFLTKQIQMKNKSGLLSLMILSVLLITLQSSGEKDKKPEREFYQLSVYHFATQEQEKTLDNYFQNALLPALHRMGINKAGVFKSWANDTVANKTLYVLIPFRSLDNVVQLPEKLKKDEQYVSAAAAYSNADYKNPPYSRMETILLRAFPLAPKMQLPVLTAPKKTRVYELRSYEGATQEKFENKVKMFNEGDEIGLFKRLNFNAVFYSEVVAGSKMPNLMYMTSFESKADRDEHWKTFSNDPYWKKLSGLPKYQNNVSHIDISFLYPTDYSDF
jgi:hypothetical protein